MPSLGPRLAQGRRKSNEKRHGRLDVGHEKRAGGSHPRPQFLSDDGEALPPMPPISGMAGADLSSGISLIAASVVISRPATEAASCSAVRTTLVGSITPAAARFS